MRSASNSRWIRLIAVISFKIDRDGTGGTYTMTQVATLQGITGLTDEAALVTSGNLLAA